MTFDHEIKLIKTTHITNSVGDLIETPTKRAALAAILDYRNKDFYQAMANGLKPEITFAVNKYEYEGEKEVEFEDKSYRIIDTYPVKAKDDSEFESLALVCSGLVND